MNRKKGPAKWEFLWREVGPAGDLIPRTTVIGSIEQYPTEESASAAINGLRVSVNDACNRQFHKSARVGDIVDHYIKTELGERSEYYSEATKMIYMDYLRIWIRPQWAMVDIRDVRTVAVENWLRQLCRKNGKPLSNSSKAKIRNLMSVLFNHAIRYEWLEQGKNPITHVRQSAARQTDPEMNRFLFARQLRLQLTLTPFLLLAPIVFATFLDPSWIRRQLSEPAKRCLLRAINIWCLRDPIPQCYPRLSPSA